MGKFEESRKKRGFKVVLSDDIFKQDSIIKLERPP